MPSRRINRQTSRISVTTRSATGQKYYYEKNWGENALDVQIFDPFKGEILAKWAFAVIRLRANRLAFAKRKLTPQLPLVGQSDLTAERRHSILKDTKRQKMQKSFYDRILTRGPILPIDITFYSGTWPLTEPQRSERPKALFVTSLRDCALCKISYSQW